MDLLQLKKAFLRFEKEALKAILVIVKLSEYGHFHDILSNVLFLNESIGMDKVSFRLLSLPNSMLHRLHLIF